MYNLKTKKLCVCVYKTMKILIKFFLLINFYNFWGDTKKKTFATENVMIGGFLLASPIGY